MYQPRPCASANVVTHAGNAARGIGLLRPSCEKWQSRQTPIRFAASRVNSGHLLTGNTWCRSSRSRLSHTTHRWNDRVSTSRLTFGLILALVFLACFFFGAALSPVLRTSAPSQSEVNLLRVNLERECASQSEVYASRLCHRACFARTDPAYASAFGPDPL
jgi:hypothetical protein